jgi:hypothetical protein
MESNLGHVNELHATAEVLHEGELEKPCKLVIRIRENRGQRTLWKVF